MIWHFQAFIVAGGHDGSNVLSSVLTLLPGASSWTPLASLPRSLYGARASIVGGKMRLTGGSSRSEVIIWKLTRMVEEASLQWDDDNELIIFACQVLEYQPEPSNQWTTVGQLETKRGFHAVLSIGSEALPCLLGCLEQDDLFVVSQYYHQDYHYH